MKIRINDDEMEFSGETLLEMIVQRGFKDKTGIAIAVNEIVVSKTEWHRYFLKENDAILVIAPAQGG